VRKRCRTAQATGAIDTMMSPRTILRAPMSKENRCEHRRYQAAQSRKIDLHRYRDTKLLKNCPVSTA